MATYNVYRENVGIEKIPNLAQLTCDVCCSAEIKETRDGYVCASCGIVLEIQRFQYYRPYNADIIQHSVLDTTQIGTRRERLLNSNSIILEKLHKLHSLKTNESTVLIQAKTEIARILYALSMPSSHKNFVFEIFKKIRNALKIGTKYRSVDKLVPICVYFSQKMQNMSINEKILLEISKITRKEFNAFKLQIKNFYPKYGERNRKEYILQKVLEITEHFNLGMAFFYQSKKILYKLWDGINNTKDDVIAGLISSISLICSSQNKISINAVCNRLQIKMSTIQSQVKKRIFERFKVQGFSTLKKSSEVLRKIMIQKGILDFPRAHNEDIIEVKFGNAIQVRNPINNSDCNYFYYLLRDKNNKLIFLTLGVVKIPQNLKQYSDLTKSKEIKDNNIFFELELSKFHEHKGPPIISKI